MAAYYDFRSLSDYDFEILARDLLSEHLGIYFNNFKKGPDGGIDLRYASNTEGDTIVQCKHYARTPFSRLLKDLVNGKHQIDDISPNRYIVFTSLELSNKQKETILSELSPHINSISDILGFEDINYLLDVFPDVQKRNFKLWLSSISMLDIVIHRKMRNRSRFLFEKILEESKRFVVTDVYQICIDLLKQYNFCLISGAPGTGKTTLAKVLVLLYSSKGYEIVYISKDIDEAFDAYEEGKRQIFYFDDFLGITRLLENSLHHDQRILDFIDLISRSENSFLVLTTRELILNQAIEYFDNFSYSVDKIYRAKQIVITEDYTLYQRALILYNHIYHSKINNGQIGKYISFVKYKKIIEHRNYNPRIIDIVLNGNKEVNEKNFSDIIIENLDNPSKIWKPVLENHITDPAKSLISLLFIFEKIDMISLKEEYIALQRSAYEMGHRYDTSNDFEYVIKELDNTLISILDSDNNKDITFVSPSLGDYLNIYYIENPLLLMISVKNIRDFNTLWKIASSYRKQIRESGKLENFSAFHAPDILDILIQNIKNQISNKINFLDKIGKIQHIHSSKRDYK